jgi:serine/threonine protein kinase
MKQLARGVEYIHLQGVFHRDIKAENVLLSKGGQVKIADFGLAILINSDVASRAQSTTGTAVYFSPEKAIGGVEGYNSKSDMWAVGCVLLEVVTCSRLLRPIWNDASEVRAQRNGWIRQVADASALLGKVAEALLDVDPQKRADGKRMFSILQGTAAAAGQVRIHPVPSLQAQSDAHLQPPRTCPPAGAGPLSCWVAPNRLLRAVHAVTAPSNVQGGAR